MDSIVITAKPSRADLLRVIEELQGLIGEAEGHHHNDRSQDAHAKQTALLQQAFNLCVRARSFDPPRLRARRP